MLAANNERFQAVTTKLTTDKQTTNWPTFLFETEYFNKSIGKHTANLKSEEGSVKIVFPLKQN